MLCGLRFDLRKSDPPRNAAQRRNGAGSGECLDEPVSEGAAKLRPGSVVKTFTSGRRIELDDLMLKDKTVFSNASALGLRTPQMLECLKDIYPVIAYHVNLEKYKFPKGVPYWVMVDAMVKEFEKSMPKKWDYSVVKFENEDDDAPRQQFRIFATQEIFSFSDGLCFPVRAMGKLKTYDKVLYSCLLDLLSLLDRCGSVFWDEEDQDRIIIEYLTSNDFGSKEENEELAQSIRPYLPGGEAFIVREEMRKRKFSMPRFMNRVAKLDLKKSRHRAFMDIVPDIIRVDEFKETIGKYCYWNEESDFWPLEPGHIYGILWSTDDHFYHELNSMHQSRVNEAGICPLSYWQFLEAGKPFEHGTEFPVLYNDLFNKLYDYFNELDKNVPYIGGLLEAIPTGDESGGIPEY